MRLLIIALAALPMGAATAEAPAPAARPPVTRFVQLEPKAECAKPLAFLGAGPGRAEMKRLNELPPADAFHAVLRVDGKGCLDPVMVGYQYGRRHK